MNKLATTTRRVTLVELLVVIAIIGVLIAVLLPAIGRAQLNARMLQHSTNIRGMTAAYVNYATDQKSTLPMSMYSFGTPPYWFQVIGYFDQTSVLSDYGMMPLTASPLLGNARYDDPANTFSSRGLPFFYFPTDPATLRLACTVPGFETTNCVPPLRLDKGRSDNVILQDLLTLEGPNSYWANLPNDPAMLAAAYAYVPNMPSHRHISFTSLDQIQGCYTGCYDGSVRLRKTAEARWVGYYYPTVTTYQWAHFQPE